MAVRESIFNLDGLKQAESGFRERLAAQPDDMRTRVNLAWCLFIRALHQAGQESMLAALAAAEHPGEPVSVGRAKITFDTNSEELIQDSLRQAFTVRQLSMQSEECSAAEQLQALVRLSGGAEAVCTAAEDAVRILAEITWEVIQGAPEEKLEC